MTRSARRAPSTPSIRRKAALLLILLLLTEGMLGSSAATVLGADPAADPATPAPSANEPSADPSPSADPDPSDEPSAEPSTGVTLATPVDPIPAVEVVPPASDPRMQPSIHYEQAMAHARDKIRFTPGGLVTRAFTPRAGDTWPVDGKAPRRLPAGNATGAAITKSPQGSTWAVRAPGQSSSIDSPVVAPSDVIQADGTAAVLPAAEPLALGAAKRLKQVFGFLPYWEVSDSANNLDYRVLSTIAYFSVGSDENGNLLKKNADGTPTTGWGGWGSAKLTETINAAHVSDTRFVLTITMFAWTSSQAQRQGALLGNAAARLNLARQAAIAVRDRGADGINLDFEPIATGYDDEFTALVRTFRAELNKIAPGYQLTFDTTGFIGNYPIENATAPGGADAIFIMGYDYRTASQPTVGSIAPLAGPAYDVTDTVDAFAARVPASKLILGVPYYGRAWSTDTDAVRAKNISGTKYGASNSVVYATAAEYAAENGRRWDDREYGPYVVYHRENCTPTYGCVNPWRQLYYDDAQSLRLKYDMVNAKGLRGAGIWALGYDDSRPELNQVLADEFLSTDTRAPGVTLTTSSAWFAPNGDGIAERVTLAWSIDEAATGTVRIRQGAIAYRTWPAHSGGSIVWDGLDRAGRLLADGRYTFQVDVTDPSGNRAVANAEVRIDRTADRMAWSPPLFFPSDGDAYAKTAKVSFRLTRAAATTLRIYTQAGGYVKTAWVGRTFAAGTWGWTWNGIDGRGHRAPRGWYRAVLTTTSSIGVTTLNKLVLLDAFSVIASPPSPAGGQTLTLTLRSAEPLGAAPVVTFRQSGKAAVAKTASSLGAGRYVVKFTVVAGAPGPATIGITARDGTGRTNAQSFAITVR